MAVDRATIRLQKEDRQVRLKWSRKKVVGGIHTKQSLTSIMKDFGEVEEVELLGSKGNAALVTFAHESSCKPCVDAYRTSETMRATFVGRKKHQESLPGDLMGEDDDSSLVRSGQHSENPEERKLRQAAERERLMRQMEVEENGGDESFQRVYESPKQSSEGLGTSKARTVQHVSSFPPDFPSSERKSMLPFELLEKYENLLFDRIDKLKS
jgi:DnaJ family protein C protein 17